MGGSFRFLTRNYVEALGLPVVPLDLGRDQRMVCCREHAPRTPRFVGGVMFNGRGYVREADGLAYRRWDGHGR